MTSAHPQRRGRTAVPEPEVTYHHADQFEPGEYLGNCRAANIHRDKGYRRWVCTLQFELRSKDLLKVLGRTSMFFNLGAGERPHAGRRGKYWTASVQANGGPPRRGDRLSPRIFQGRMARIVVGDVPEKFYSVVREIRKWET